VLYYTPRFILDTAVDPSPPPLQAAGKGLIPYSEVNKHDNEGDCWVVINGKVYDLTEVRHLSFLHIYEGIVQVDHERVDVWDHERVEGSRRGRKGKEEKANISSPENPTRAAQPQSTEQQEKMLLQYSTHFIHLGRSKMV